MLSCDDDQGRARCGSAARWARDSFEGIREVTAETSLRFGGEVLDAAHAVLAPVSDREPGDRRAGGPETKVAFWRCSNERAEAQAVAREIESLLAGG